MQRTLFLSRTLPHTYTLSFLTPSCVLFVGHPIAQGAAHSALLPALAPCHTFFYLSFLTPCCALSGGHPSAQSSACSAQGTAWRCLACVSPRHSHPCAWLHHTCKVPIGVARCWLTSITQRQVSTGKARACATPVAASFLQGLQLVAMRVDKCDTGL